MTIRERCAAALETVGMPPAAAQAAIDLYLAGPTGEPMRGRLDDPLADYPTAVLTTTWLGVRAAAVEWVDANQPRAWYRSLLVDDHQTGGGPE